jgi:ferric-dicitrate binding protein FerR (iron transport regulator)
MFPPIPTSCKKSAALACMVLLLAAALIPASPAQAGRQEYTFEEERTMVLEPGTLITLQNVSGEIDVRGWDGDHVRVISTKRIKARSREEAREWAGKVEIIIEKDGPDLLVKAKRPKDWTESLESLLDGIFQRKPSASVDFEISTPPDVHLEISSVSGDISARDITGEVAIDVVSGDMEIIDTGSDVIIDAVSGDMLLEKIAGNVDVDAISGDIHLEEIGGNVRIDVTSGDVNLKRIDGDLYVDGTSGDISAGDVFGDVNIDVTSGDISVLQKGGELRIDTSSGDVTVETDLISSGHYLVETSSGQIIFRVPSDASSIVDMETSGGTITAKVPMTIESMSRTHLVGILGNGEGEIVLSTSGGDIDLLPSD